VSQACLETNAFYALAQKVLSLLIIPQVALWIKLHVISSGYSYLQ